MRVLINLSGFQNVKTTGNIIVLILILNFIPYFLPEIWENPPSIRKALYVTFVLTHVLTYCYFYKWLFRLSPRVVKIILHFTCYIKQHKKTK